MHVSKDKYECRPGELYNPGYSLNVWCEFHLTGWLTCRMTITFETRDLKPVLNFCFLCFSSLIDIPWIRILTLSLCHWEPAHCGGDLINTEWAKGKWFPTAACNINHQWQIVSVLSNELNKQITQFDWKQSLWSCLRYFIYLIVASLVTATIAWESTGRGIWGSCPKDILWYLLKKLWVIRWFVTKAGSRRCPTV